MNPFLKTVKNAVVGVVNGNADGNGSIVKDLGDVVNTFILTPDEKVAANQKIQEALNKYNIDIIESVHKTLETELADTANARDMNVKIQESDKASWLSKNVAFIIDIFLTLIWGSITVYIVGKTIRLISDKTDMTAVMSLYATITAIYMIVVNYHRGSSSGSVAKEKQMNKMINDQK